MTSSTLSILAMHPSSFYAVLALALAPSAALAGGGSLPNSDGWAAVTCGTRSIYPVAERYTFGLIDVNAPVFGASHYNAPMFHDASWTVDQIGNVFGVTWDNDRDIYVTASSNIEGYAVTGTLPDALWRYGSIGGGANSVAAAGTVYKIDGQTGAVSVFAQLPQQSAVIKSVNYGTRVTGPGLGNIAYDTNHDQFFVTNDEDGTIYRIDATGTVQSSFDPLGADDGSAGFAPRGERLWGIGLINGRVYYSVWPAEDAQPTVRSVELNAGEFVPASDRLELTASFVNVGHPISDIEFSADGRMLVGQRTMASFDNFGLTYSELDVYNHRSSTAVFELNGGVWSEVRDWGISVLGGNTPESYGGTDWADLDGVNDVVWSSAADMLTTSGGSHGICGIRYVDMSVDPSAAPMPISPIRYDPNATGDPKGLGGDIAVIGRTRPPCTGLFVAPSVDTNYPSCNHFTDADLTGGLPKIGEKWCWDMQSIHPNTAYWLYGSIGKPGQPYSLFGTCDIWPDLFALISFATGSTDANGNRSACILIPNDPTLIGLSVTMQARLCDPTYVGDKPIAGVPDFFSNAICITVGCP
ncbi:hypothetical protein [Planctomycetes bacterium Pla163]